MSELRTDSISRTYASALFELAKQKEQGDTLTLQVAQLGELIKKNPMLLRLISTPAISAAQRKSIIKNIFEGKVDNYLYNFLQILANKNRLSYLENIIKAYGDLVSDAKGIIEVDIFVPQKLDESQFNKTSSAIGKALGGKEISLHQYIDESLIGGMKIKIGDKLIDASVASWLKDIQRKMIIGKGKDTK